MEMAKRLVVTTVVLAVVATVVLAVVVVWNLETNRRAEKLVIDENDFVIRDTMFWWDSVHPDTGVICSNGSAWYNTYIAWSNPPRYDNHSMKLSPALALEALHILEQENFLSLKDSYEDTGQKATGPSGNNLTEWLTIESHGKNKTVTFAGNSMTGILPRSSQELGDIESDVYAGKLNSANLTLNVSANLSQDQSTLTISGTLFINGNITIWGYYDGRSVWRVTVIRSDGCTVAEFPRGYDPSVDGTFVFRPNSTNALNNYTLNITGFSPGTYVIWGVIGGFSASASGFTIVQIPSQRDIMA